MQAVILAGGLGTRLRPITHRIAKPMVPVAGKPYLEHQLQLLRQQSITDVILLVGYLGHQIEDYFADGRRFGLTVRYSREESPLGTGGALREAQQLLDQRFLLIYGDSYLPTDYGLPMERLAASAAKGAIVLYDNRLEDTSVTSNIAVDSAGYVTRYEKDRPSDPELHYVDAGVLALDRSILELMPSDGIVSLEKEVFPKLIAQRHLVGHIVTQRFYDIGNPERLHLFEEYLSHDHHSDSLSH
jgi:NDP-sugar pyrophosphorylase family protein